MSSLTRSALAGVAWNYAGAGVLVVTQIASTAVTARIVSPQQFGAYATAQAAGGILGYFTLAAVGNGVLRRSELSPKTIGTAISVSVTAGAIVAIGLWLLADPWANAWHVPAAARVVRVVAFTVFFTSAATIPLALLRRHLRFRAAAIAETGTQILGAAVGVGLAFHLHSAFALAAGQSAAAAALLGASAVLAFRDLELGFSRAEARELLSFAGQVSALNFGSYLMNTAPIWYTARNFGTRTLGVYSRANVIVGLPLTYLSSGLMKVLYPLYGRVQGDQLRTRDMLDEGITMSTGFVWPLFALVAGAAPVIVKVLLGPGWSGTAPLLALFALLACGNLPCGLLTNAGEAFGWMRMIWGRQLTYFALLAADIAVVHVAGWGVNTLVVGIVIVEWLTYAVTLHAFVRRGFLDVRVIMASHAAHFAVSVSAFGAAALCAYVLRSAPLAVQVAAQIGVGLVVCATLFFGRPWFPAGRILAQRLEQALPGYALDGRVRFSRVSPP